jgi:hypothetical protein
MEKLWNRLRGAFGGNPPAAAISGPAPGVTSDTGDGLWDNAYAARAAFYETHFGRLPDDAPNGTRKSFVPAKIRIKAWGSDPQHTFETTLDLW